MSRDLIICTCGRELRTYKNGVFLRVNAVDWRAGDLLGCEQCGYTVITRITEKAIHASQLPLDEVAHPRFEMEGV